MEKNKKYLEAAALTAAGLLLAALFSKTGGLLQKAAGLAAGGPCGSGGAQPADLAPGAADGQVLADACTEKTKDVLFIGCNGLYE